MHASLAPPGVAEDPQVRSALVLAPHPDDEVLGCGGVVRRWTRRGGVVRVLFLTDGGRGGAGERAVLVARRKSEARAACTVLGVQGVEHLGYPDGGLAGEHTELARDLRRALLGLRPEVLLVPSPIEASSDHRAAFAAVHDLVSGADASDPLSPVLDRLQIWAYEVNRPLVPDLLVDVSSELPDVERAMECYASQQKAHDYWAARRGLLHYRTLTLPPGSHGAEAFRRLQPDHLRASSAEDLVDEIGGFEDLREGRLQDGPRVSVVVRTRDRPTLLAQALASLDRSTWRAAEVVLVNDGGAPPEVPEGFDLPVVRVHHETSRGRAAAANAGLYAATGDVVTFLDDDDLVEPSHLATLAALGSAAGVRAAYTDAAVGVWELGDAGWQRTQRRLTYSRDFDPERLLVDNYIPLCTLVVERQLAIDVGGFDETLPFFEDWDFLLRLAARVPLRHLARVTCEYRQFRGAAHHVLGDRPRERADFHAMKARVLARHRDRLDDEVLARVIDGLRAETVEEGERVRSLRDDLHHAREEGHRSNGRAVGLEVQVRALEQHRERLAWELSQRVDEVHQRTRERDEERERTAGVRRELEELREAAEERSEQLRAAYSEIERLGALISTMETTRAWKLHRWLERRRG